MAAGFVTPRPRPLGAEPSRAPDRGPPDRPSLRLGLEGEASGLGGLDALELNLGLSDGPWRLRVGAAGTLQPRPDAAPSVGLTLSGPALAAGAVEPSGLASFILRPHGLSYRLYLPSGRGKPLASAPPLAAGWRGAAVGAEGGLFALEPSACSAPAFIGAWAAPTGSGISALLAAARASAKAGDGSWYAAPLPPRGLAWLAGAAAFGGGPYLGSLALAVESAAPGADAYALRHESRVKLAPFTMELVAAFAGSPSYGGAATPWFGPRFVRAPPAFAQATMSFARRRDSAWLRYTGELAPASGEPRHALDLGLGLGVPSISFQARANYRAPFAEAAERVGAAFRLCLGRSAAGATRAPAGFSAFGSWRAEGGRPLALELGAGFALASGARRPALRAEAAWRAAPSARSYRWRLELELPLSPTATLAAFGRSPGWIAYELPGGIAAPGEAPGLELGLRVSAALMLY